MWAVQRDGLRAAGRVDEIAGERKSLPVSDVLEGRSGKEGQCGMKQYCRYCAFCIEGDCFYCTEHEEVLSEARIRRANTCPEFALSDLGDVETVKSYIPRKVKRDDGANQITIWNTLSQA